jgi:hypothetical protein
MKKNHVSLPAFIAALLITFPAPGQNLSSFDVPVWIEEDGVVIAEAENIPHNSVWELRTDPGDGQKGCGGCGAPDCATAENLQDAENYTGSGYLRTNSANNSSDNWLVMKVKITNPGQYYAKIRGYHLREDGDNDVYMGAFGPGVNIGGKKIADCNVRIYSWPDWDNRIKPNFGSAGTYAVWVGPRSRGMGVDRIVVYRDDAATRAKALNPATPESKKEGDTTDTDPDHDPDPNPPATLTLKAVTDFDYTVSGQTPYYKDGDFLAIDATKYKNIWATAEYVYTGKDYIYKATVSLRVENDGEPPARLLVNDEVVGDSIKPAYTDGKWRTETHTWKDIILNNGDRIWVQTQAYSNQKVREGSGYGYGRGRWSQLVLEPDKPIPVPVTMKRLAQIHDRSGIIALAGNALYIPGIKKADKLIIYDLSGKVILKKYCSNADRYTDLNELNNGACLCRLIRDNRIISSKTLTISNH